MSSNKLIYIVGASGSGKDTLLSLVRNEIDFEAIPLIFVHRYITRPVELTGENHIFLSEKEFMFRREAGLFAMSWQSHGFYYGIGREINEWLNSGSLVLMNGSREYIPKALEIYPEMRICLIQTSREKLKERLINRGRESMSEIEERLNRFDEFSVNYPNVITINNDGNIVDTKKYFLGILIDALK